MATNVNRLFADSPIVPLAAPDGVARQISLALKAVGLVLILGTLIDLGVLWLVQRQPGPQWEFVGVMATLEAFPRLVIGLGLGYVALLAGGESSRLMGRVVAGVFLLLGLASLVLGGILITDYFILVGLVDETSTLAFHSTLGKGLALSAIYTLFLVPLGAFGAFGRRVHPRRP